MRAVDARQALDACKACAREIRATAMDRGTDLGEEDRVGLFALATLIERKARARLAARPAVERAIEQMLAMLDALDGDPEREPDLGAPENHPSARADQDRWAQGSDDGRELDGVDDEDGGDDEVTLGAPERGLWHSQVSWAAGSRHEGEGEAEPGYDLPEGDDERCGSDQVDGEAYLGAPENHDEAPDQRKWAQGEGLSVEEERGEDEVDKGDYQRLAVCDANKAAAREAGQRLAAIVARKWDRRGGILTATWARQSSPA